MGDEAIDLDELLVDVRKTISDNKQFLEKLVDETTESADAEESVAEDEYEEL